MRDARPLERDAVVGDHVGAEVQLVEREILFAQRVRRESLARAVHLAHDLLKLGEHRLAVHRALELVKEVIDEIGALLLVGRLAEQMAHEQYLVAGGGDLSHEDDVRGGIHRLVLAAVVAVQRVAHFVGEREHAVEIILVVEQDIGVRVAVAGGIRAAALAGIFVNVDPAVGKALLQQVGIILAEHRERFEHRGLGFLVGDLAVGIRHDGGVHVVHVQLVHAEQLLAQRNIAVHLVHVRVDGLDEIVVNLLRHLRHVERGGAGGGIMPRVREELERAELPVERRGDGIFEFTETVIISFKGVFAQHAVAAHEQGDERPARENALVSFAVGHGREREIGVAEDAGDIFRAVRHLSGGGEELFLLRGEDVRLAAANFINIAAVGLQLRLRGIEEIHRVLVERHDLRRFKRARRVDGDERRKRLGAHALINAVAGVLVALAVRVAVELFKPHGERIVQAEPLQKRLRALAESAAERFDLLRHGLERFILRLPRLVAFKYVLEIPGRFLRHFAACRDGSVCH